MSFTEKQKKNIIDRNYDWLKPYISKVFFDAPEIDNSMTVEGIALEWAKLEERNPEKRVTIKDAIKAYEKSYKADAKFVQEKTGESMPELKIDTPDVTIVVNDEKSSATIETLQREASFVEDVIKADGNPYALMFDEEKERFFGTVPDKDILKKVERVNELLEVIAIGADASISKCETLKPRSESAVFAITYNGLNGITGTALKCFRKIVETVDEVFVVPKTNNSVRISFAINNLWKEHRLLSDSEMEEFENDEE